MTREQETRSVWDWLDQVRQRPGMWLGRTDTPVQDLQMLVSGYYAALQTHGIVEEGPAMTHFSTWLRMTTNWSVSCGWAVAIAEHAEGRDALALFFELADRFKLLQPTILSRVTLAEWHRPTGSRTGIGVGGRIERPDRVDIIRYEPEPIHILQFHYGPRRIDQSALHTTEGSDATTPADAKTWMQDELLVEPNEWQDI